MMLLSENASPVASWPWRCTCNALGATVGAVWPKYVAATAAQQVPLAARQWRHHMLGAEPVSSCAGRLLAPNLQRPGGQRQERDGPDRRQPHTLLPDEHPWRLAGWRPGSWQERRLSRPAKAKLGRAGDGTFDAELRERMAALLLRGGGGGASPEPDQGPGDGHAPDLAGITDVPEAMSGAAAAGNPAQGSTEPRAPPGALVADQLQPAREDAPIREEGAPLVRISVRAGAASEAQAGGDGGAAAAVGASDLREPPPGSGERPRDAASGTGNVLLAADGGDIDFGAEAARGIISAGDPRPGSDPLPGGDAGGLPLPTTYPALTALAEKSAAALAGKETLNPETLTLAGARADAQPQVTKGLQMLPMKPKDPNQPDGVWEEARPQNRFCAPDLHICTFPVSTPDSAPYENSAFGQVTCNWWPHFTYK